MRVRGFLCRFCWLLVAAPLLFLAGSASATVISSSFDFFIPVVPDDDSGVSPSVTANFTWDDACSVGCTLELGLVYNDVGGLTTTAHALAGVTWDVTGAIVVNESLSIVLAPTLVGLEAATALAELPGPTTINGVTGAEVTGHWSFRDDLSNALDVTVPIEWDSLGDYVLTAVGDVTFGGATSDATGGDHLLPGVISSVEGNPTDGAPFTIVDPSTTTVAGKKGDVVFAQGSVTAFLNYDGVLTDIGNVTPLFGTDGVAIVPEPGTGMLLALGLFVMGVRARREN
jgi:hypothetical protein